MKNLSKKLRKIAKLITSIRGESTANYHIPWELVTYTQKLLEKSFDVNLNFIPQKDENLQEEFLYLPFILEENLLERAQIHRTAQFGEHRLDIYAIAYHSISTDFLKFKIVILYNRKNALKPSDKLKSIEEKLKMIAREFSDLDSIYVTTYSRAGENVLNFESRIPRKGLIKKLSTLYQLFKNDLEKYNFYQILNFIDLSSVGDNIYNKTELTLSERLYKIISTIRDLKQIEQFPPWESLVKDLLRYSPSELEKTKKNLPHDIYEDNEIVQINELLDLYLKIQSEYKKILNNN